MWQACIYCAFTETWLSTWQKQTMTNSIEHGGGGLGGGGIFHVECTKTRLMAS